MGPALIRPVVQRKPHTSGAQVRQVFSSRSSIMYIQQIRITNVQTSCTFWMNCIWSMGGLLCAPSVLAAPAGSGLDGAICNRCYDHNRIKGYLPTSPKRQLRNRAAAVKPAAQGGGQ